MAVEGHGVRRCNPDAGRHAAAKPFRSMPEQLMGGGSGPCQRVAQLGERPRRIHEQKLSGGCGLIESAPPGWLKAPDGCGKPGFESAREPAQHGVGLHT